MRSPLLIVAIAVASSCGPPPPARTVEQRTVDTAPALAQLRAGNFAEASRAADGALALDPRNAQAAATRAMATYVTATDALIGELTKVADRADALHYFDHDEGRAIWTRFLAKLEVVDRDLAVAAADPAFSLELCLACWDHDWNHSGAIDERDHKLFEIEYDGAGNSLPDADARRRPTFRFDVGDVNWARAMISFQRAAVELVLAYQWTDLDKLFAKNEMSLTIKLIDKDRVTRARERILAGIGFAERCRTEYLAETDDDREWVPNPHQHGAVPLPVDDALYERWGAILGDVRRLLSSQEGVSLIEVAALIDSRAVLVTPNAYVDLGRMLSDPQDIIIDVPENGKTRSSVERVLRGLVGHGYREQMKPSPLVGRLARIKSELDHGDETVSRKLRYLFWLN